MRDDSRSYVQTESIALIRAVAIGGGQGGQSAPLVGRNLEKLATKTGKIRKNGKEKGQIGKKMGSLPGACPCGREELATALALISCQCPTITSEITFCGPRNIACLKQKLTKG